MIDFWNASGNDRGLPGPMDPAGLMGPLVLCTFVYGSVWFWFNPVLGGTCSSSGVKDNLQKHDFIFEGIERLLVNSMNIVKIIKHCMPWYDV